MEIQTPVVAILISLILSRWRTIEGVPLNSHRKLSDEIIELEYERTVKPSLNHLQNLLLEEFLEPVNTDTSSSISLDKKNDIFQQSSRDRPTSYSTEQLRQIVRSLSPKSQPMDILSSLKFEQEIINAVLRNQTHPLESRIPEDVKQALKQVFIIPEEAGLPRTIRSKRGTRTQQMYCEHRGQIYSGYLKLCKTCHVTTHFHDNYSPRSVSEIICGSNHGESEKTCLTGRGRCGERRLPITRYRQVGGVLQSYFQPIRVGCECELDPFSNLATLA
ncbi:hypothetical protein HOLleu_33428 [Holothuria leucospilota]|uniref:Uncharacterized protein n=1 Tax=Holothuria leucospilota TaxID=206669 RepID=A0A9Q0YNL3_HOLLE|nr:hypothetical protein HOLleu_33428 [Holothuria leucospilota]